MFDTIKRMAANLLAILQVRAELLTVEIEEEVLRLFVYLVLSLVALICFSVAILLGILLIIVVFWDVNRVAVVAVLMGFFGIAACAIGLGVRHCYRNKPQFLSNTLSEISKDIEMLKPSGEEQTP